MSENDSITHDAPSLTNYLHLFKGALIFRAFPRDKKSEATALTWHIPPGKDLPFDEFLDAQEGDARYGIYLAQNDFGDSGSNLTEDIQRVRVIFIDDDTKTDFDREVRPPSDFPVPYSFHVSTSPGCYHYIWRVDVKGKKGIARAKALQRRIVDAEKGDPNAKDISRVLRIPTLVNTKYDPAPLVTWELNNEDIVDFDTLDKAYPIPTAKVIPISSASGAESEVEWEQALYLIDQFDAESAFKREDWLKVLMGIANEFKAKGLELAHKFSQKCPDKYDADDVEKTYSSLLKPRAKGEPTIKWGTVVYKLQGAKKRQMYERFCYYPTKDKWVDLTAPDVKNRLLSPAAFRNVNAVKAARPSRL